MSADELIDLSGVLLFSGRVNASLSEKVGEAIGLPVAELEVCNFSDGEIFARILVNVRGRDVFVIQPTCMPVNDSLMELLIIIDALKRSSAKRITAVLPYYGYARQDRKVESRTPITAKLVADLICRSGVDRVLTMDLHAGQIAGFFDVPVDHLYASPLLINYFKEKNLPDIMILSPDAGGVERARAFAKRLDCGLGIIDKRREAKNVAKAMNIIGDVRGKNVVIVDDMIDTAGTLTEAVAAVYEHGARGVYACATHAVLSGPAFERIEKSPVIEVVVTDTIPLGDRNPPPPSKIKVISVGGMLGEAIKRIHTESSVSSLFY